MFKIYLPQFHQEPQLLQRFLYRLPPPYFHQVPNHPDNTIQENLRGES